MAAVFEVNPDGETYDLKIDGRAAEYDLEPHEFAGALRRRRVGPDVKVFVEDATGYRERWRGR